MINSVISGISKSLYKEFGYNVYKEEVKQGLEPPCFIIECQNPMRSRYLGNKYHCTYKFVIYYFTNESNLNVNATTDRLFKALEYIEADGNLIRGSKMEMRYYGKVLNFFVDYDFFEIEKENKTSMRNIDGKISAN